MTGFDKPERPFRVGSCRLHRAAEMSIALARGTLVGNRRPADVGVHIINNLALESTSEQRGAPTRKSFRRCIASWSTTKTSWLRSPRSKRLR
ncbi:hypothetical protein B0G73_14629 [Paraburkholderia sp. BL25I1N1]|nr:hypothetical protein B0G73_14629 [Paraburkholderia sp. BL25I1N1]